MSGKDNSGIDISDKDIAALEEMASKYNMSVADFYKAVLNRGNETSVKVNRWVRLSQDEYDSIKKKVDAHGITFTYWCALACHSFLESEVSTMQFYGLKNNYKRNRTQRVCVALKDGSEDARLSEIAGRWNIGLSSLIRYCLLTYDGHELLSTDGPDGS